MEIKKKVDCGTLYVTVSGAINTLTAPDIEKELGDNFNGLNKIVFDLKEVDYISSAGLRLFTALKFAMAKQGGSFDIVNVSEAVDSIFQVTNFYELLEIKRK